MADVTRIPSYWSRTADDLLVALGGTRAGLGTDAAEARLERYGENSVAGGGAAGPWRLLAIVALYIAATEIAKL